MKIQKGISTFFAILVVGLIALIGFVAFYSYQNIWTPEAEEGGVELIKESEPKISVPGNWETYRNEKYRFEMKYPPGENLSSFSESQEKLSFSYWFPERSEKGMVINTFNIRVEDNNSNLSLLEWIQRNEKCNVDLNSYKEIKVNGLEGIRIKGPAVCPPGAGGIAHKIYISREAKIYSIELIEENIRGKSEEAIEDQNKTFERVLSNFNFIEKKREGKRESSIEILTPGEGALATGVSYEIRWNAEDMEKTDIGIVVGKIAGPYARGQYIAENIDASVEKYSWTVPHSLTGANYLKIFVGELPSEAPGYFKLKIGEGVYDQFGYFTVRSSESPNFLLPQEDEQWKIGEEKTILLDQVFAETQPPFYHLSLFNEKNEEIGMIKCKIGNYRQNSFKWVVRSLLNYCGAGLEGKISPVIPGKYKIGIVKDKEGRPTIAESDYFFIEE